MDELIDLGAYPAQLQSLIYNAIHCIVGFICYVQSAQLTSQPTMQELYLILYTRNKRRIRRGSRRKGRVEEE